MFIFGPSRYARFELSGRCLRVRQLSIDLCHRFFNEKQRPGFNDSTYGNSQDVMQQLGNCIGNQQNKDPSVGYQQMCTEPVE